MRTARTIPTVCTVILLLLGSNLSLVAQYKPQVGSVHSDFTLPRIDTREPVSLSQFRGKKVLLIHFASW